MVVRIYGGLKFVFLVSIETFGLGNFGKVD